MELVHKRTYYHIQREKIWNINEEHFAGNNKNRYCSFFDSCGQNYQDANSGVLFPPTEVADYILDYLITGKKDAEIAHTFSYNPITVVRLLRDIVWNNARYIRETVFEEVRQEFFPSYPSRQKGIWVISDKKYIPYWYKKLGMNRDSVIFELELTGKIHEANHASIRLTTNSLNFIRKQAFKYWIGDDIIANKEIGYECIFEGFVLVKRIISIEECLRESIQNTNVQFEISANILRNFSDLPKWMKLRLSKELFAPDMVYSMHGIAHTTRVLFGTVLLIHYIQDISEDIKEAIYYAAIIHDLGRTNDDKDFTHGADSAELYCSKIEQFVSDKSLQTQILNAVKYHSLDDSLCPQEEQNIIWKVLKDADALDRGRLSIACDKSFLRLDIFKSETGDNIIDFTNRLSLYSENLTWNNPYDELIKCITENSDILNIKIL
ncbi:MAG: DUF2441 domain-containing protein [Bacteroidales bacterium]|jgi:HD superfamily phosphodiesterase|nr:DUF2441 domain-containing protein [Bacteroidales bacterium]